MVRRRWTGFGCSTSPASSRAPDHRAAGRARRRRHEDRGPAGRRSVPCPGHRASATSPSLFLWLNSGKRSVAHRLPVGVGRPDAIDRLLGRPTSWCTTPGPGSLAPYGLDWDAVHARNPDASTARSPGYGDVGPQAARGGFDLILQAESGVMSVTGSPTASGPVKVGAPLLDIGAGMSLPVRAPGRPPGAASDGRWADRCRSSLMEFALTSLGTLAATYVRLRGTAGTARDPLAHVRSVRRVPHGRRVDRPGRCGLGGSLDPLLPGVGRRRARRRSAVRGQRVSRATPRRADPVVRSRARDGAECPLAGAARGRRRSRRGGPRHRSGVRRRADRGARRRPDAAPSGRRATIAWSACRCASTARRSPTRRRRPRSAHTRARS